MNQQLAVVLDDSEFLSLLLQRQLEALGLAAQAVGNEADLLAQADNAVVVFIDVQLGQGNAFQITRRVVDRGKPVVLLTGTGRATDLHWGARAGASAVLLRPIESDWLREVLLGLGIAVAA